jgi:undecaprenyl-diphosphatase
MNKRTLLLVVIPLLLFSLLAICVFAGVTTNFEGWAYSEAVEKMSPLTTSIVKSITHIGDTQVVISFCLLLIVIPKSRKTIAMPVSLAVILSFLLNIVLKNIFARERPNIMRLINETSYSFPSGHAMINASLYTILILLIFRFIKNKPVKITLSAVCMVLVIAIGFSRVYLGVHYAGDVIGGWLIGFALSVLVYFIWTGRIPTRRMKNSRQEDRPAPYSKQFPRK